MTAEKRIQNLEKRIDRLERKLLQNGLAGLKAQLPKSKSFRSPENKYRIRKYLMS